MPKPVDKMHVGVWSAGKGNPLFGDTFERCWQLGQALEPGNAERYAALSERLASQRQAEPGGCT